MTLVGEDELQSSSESHAHKRFAAVFWLQENQNYDEMPDWKKGALASHLPAIATHTSSAVGCNNVPLRLIARWMCTVGLRCIVAEKSEPARSGLPFVTNGAPKGAIFWHFYESKRIQERDQRGALLRGELIEAPLCVGCFSFVPSNRILKR
jgi:hypothetical protein